MFKMNPAAKEFVPAHILKKRQEEAERLSEQLDKINIKSGNEVSTNGDNHRDKLSDSSQGAQVDSTQITGTSDERVETESNKPNSKPSADQQNNNSATENQHPYTNNKSGHSNRDFPDNFEGSVGEEEDDRFLLNAGENLCEFNGEQFIIPRDDECEPPNRAGYDFGNDEDNEDEDVCNAFAQFLEDLPDE